MAKKRTWILVNLGIVLALLVGAEAALRLVEEPTESGGRRIVPPYVITDPADPSYWITNPDLAAPPNVDRQTFSDAMLLMNQRFAKDKPDDVMRIIITGPSPVYGASQPTWYNLSTQLQIVLHDREPNRRFEVIDMCRQKIDADELVEVVKLIGKIESDLVVIYPGGAVPTLAFDEELEGGPFGPAIGALVRHSYLFRTMYQLGQIAVNDLIMGGGGKIEPGREKHANIEQILEHQKMMNHEREGYRDFLREMLQSLNEAGRRALVLQTASNLADFEPMWSLHMTPLTPEQAQKFDELMEQGGKAMQADQAAEAVASYRAAVELSPKHAMAHYHLAKALEAQDNYAAAKKEYILARDTDASHERLFDEPTQLIEEVCREKDVPMIDTEAMLERIHPEGRIGKEFFRDLTHLTQAGLYYLASETADWIFAHMPLPPKMDEPVPDPARPHFTYKDPFFKLKLIGVTQEEAPNLAPMGEAPGIPPDAPPGPPPSGYAPPPRPGEPPPPSPR
ncbi:MAG: hypothetical protein H6684_00465 [Deltaproteobacteria bacterium]|nr:hypothetical protein [Deltaproteobacteria bacterium]MCB9487182.1 hypothetical protein [Deltaproteobacteria bacterium]